MLSGIYILSWGSIGILPPRVGDGPAASAQERHDVLGGALAEHDFQRLADLLPRDYGPLKLAFADEHHPLLLA
jgi:hypothetical protein